MTHCILQAQTETSKVANTEDNCLK